MPSLRSIWCGLWIVWTLATPAMAADWPEFRGPTADGHSPARNLPVVWGPETNVVWKVENPGEGWSSPVVAGPRLILTAALPVDGGHPDDRRLVVVCLATDSGEILWQTNVFEQSGESLEKIHSKNSHASPTPIVAENRIWVHFGTVGTACLDLDGKVLWRNDELKYRPQHGNGGSPLLVDGLLIVSCDGSDVQYVVALDAASGQLRWKKDRPQINRGQKFSFSTPQLITVEGVRQVVSPGTNRVVAYAPADGTELWQVDYDGYSVIPRPVYVDGLLYVATGYNRPSLLAIRPDGRGDLTSSAIEWSTDRAAPHTPSLLIVDGLLYMVSDRGIATCLEAATGTVVWTERLGGSFSASPLYADGRIYLTSEEGVTHVIEPGRTFHELARNDLQERTLASLAAIDGALFLRTATHLYRLAGSSK